MRDILQQPDDVIALVQTEKLRAMLALCARGHPYYKRKWYEAGVDVSQINSLSELESLPLTSKQDLMDDPESFRLQLPDLPLHERVLWEVIYTTGTTSEPTPVYNTTHDYHAYLFQSARVSEISDIRETDVIANLFPLTPAPMGAFVRSATNAYAAGATIFGVLPGAAHGAFNVHRSMNQAVRSIALHRATILWGIPSFIRRVLLQAIETGADFRSVRMCAITGEASSPSMRDEIRRCLRLLGAHGTIVFDRYGSTEMGAFAQCHEEGDWHNPAPEIQFHEIVDPDTGRRLPDGERGALAVTHLDRRGTVLIRFLVGDVVSIDRTPCPHCGRHGERIIGPVVRTKDLVKVKGMLINPAVLLDALQGLADVDEVQVVVQRVDLNDPFSMDELLVRMSTKSLAKDQLANDIADRVQQAVRVKPRVEFTNVTDIYDPASQTKARRFVDKR
jgi:phenylacetate-coenzyme A ligase PaaK-like adenylate-forming protein